MARPVVILFARAPRLGAVKRRLARGIGARAALRFYRATLAATARPIARDRRWRTSLAVTPAGARADWARLVPRAGAEQGQLTDPETARQLGRVLFQELYGLSAIHGASLPHPDIVGNLLEAHARRGKPARRQAAGSTGRPG